MCACDYACASAAYSIRPCLPAHRPAMLAVPWLLIRTSVYYMTSALHCKAFMACPSARLACSLAITSGMVGQVNSASLVEPLLGARLPLLQAHIAKPQGCSSSCFSHESSQDGIDLGREYCSACIRADSASTNVGLSPVSRSPFSGLSDPCTTLRPVCTAKSPRIVPASASRGFVAPMSLRADLTTPLPSQTCSHRSSHTCLSAAAKQRGKKGR